MDYIRLPDNVINTDFGSISEFTSFDGESNIDKKVVEDFGIEWSKFNDFDKDELKNIGKDYFDIIEEIKIVTHESIVLDAGCGAGRWSKVLCNKVKSIEAIDPSNAVFIAKKILREENNVRVTKASIDTIPFADNSFDLIMSIGVLHHIPNTQDALAKLVQKIKPGGVFYGYLYYDFENRGRLFKTFFLGSDLIRRGISKLPSLIKRVICDIIALSVYLPFSRVALLVKKLFKKSPYYQNIPLSYYHDKSFLIMRNDALDRFGTRLEKRYSKANIIELAKSCGLTNVTFSDREPYWHFVAKKP